MHRVPSDVLKLITQLLDVKELGRLARTSSVLAAAAVSGFEARTRQLAPGLVHHAKRASGKPDWRKLCRKAMSFYREQPPAPRRLKAVNNPESALQAAFQTFTFTLEAFDGDPADPATTCLSAVQAQLDWDEEEGAEDVSVDAYLPPSVDRDRIAFLRVLVSRPRTGDAAVLYSGADTGEESSAGSARWFQQYKPPWVELDADADESDGEDVVGNGMSALVWKPAPDDTESSPPACGLACGAYFKKRMNQDGETYMPLNEVLFRLEHLLVFD